jgi:hypothetical protein
MVHGHDEGEPPGAIDAAGVAQGSGRAYLFDRAQVRREFKADRDLKARVLRLSAPCFPRPANPETTRALALYRKLRRESPQACPRQLLSEPAGGFV